MLSKIFKENFNGFGNTRVGKFHRLNDTLCKTNEEGGMKIKDLKLFNYALLNNRN